MAKGASVIRLAACSSALHVPQQHLNVPTTLSTRGILTHALPLLACHEHHVHEMHFSTRSAKLGGMCPASAGSAAAPAVAITPCMSAMSGGLKYKSC